MSSNGANGTSTRSEMLSDATKDFSLAVGGPIHSFLVRLGLVEPPVSRVARRILAATLLAWLPLFVLTAVNGRLMSGVNVPFLRDVEVQARFLIVLALLIAAEVTVHRGIRLMVFQFVDRQIITTGLLPKFEGCIESASRLRNSAIVELGLVAIVIGAGSVWWKEVLALPTDTWYATSPTRGSTILPAGYWYVFVSIPLIQFIAIRWYFRILVWTRLLWQLSRLNLNLVPSHPDGCCGLGFLGLIPYVLAPFLLAHSVLLAGYLADRILYEGAKLTNQRVEIVAMAAFIYLLALGPLCVFAPHLLRQRHHGLHAYGPLASELNIGFEKKWMAGQRPRDEALVGTPDISSLADYSTIFSIVKKVRPFPFGREAIVAVAVMIALPLLPLTLTMFSLRQLVRALLKVLF